jgi:dephospho-CoA kinase
MHSIHVLQQTGHANDGFLDFNALFRVIWPLNVVILSSMKTPVVIAVVGLPGAGKTEATARFVNHQFVRVGFNDIFYEEFDRWGLARNENNEQYVRVEMRNKLGRTVLAERALPVIEQAVQGGKHVLIESLYAWWDYTFLKERLGDRFQVLAIYAPPTLRYARLAVRPERPYIAELAHCRDYRQIETLEQAGPIAMADWTIQSTGTKEELHAAVDALIQDILQGGTEQGKS